MGLDARKLAFGVCKQHINTSAHPRSLISAFVICFLESNICKLATDKISIFYLVSVAEETGMKIALSETPKTDFLTTWPK